MYIDATALRTFYATPLGWRVRKTILTAIQQPWLKRPNERFIAIGYALPYLDDLTDKSEDSFALMPAKQGAVVWPNAERVSTALVFEECLPLADSSIDSIVLIHTLEFADNANNMMQEIWRVLAPNGRITIVVPNRRGLWARYENTPFGHGEPYSRRQLQRILCQTHFTTNTIHESLLFSPSSSWLGCFLSLIYQHIIARFLPRFGGVLVGQAQKCLYQGVTVKRHQTSNVLIPALSPQPSTSYKGLRRHFKD